MICKSCGQDSEIPMLNFGKGYNRVERTTTGVFSIFEFNHADHNDQAYRMNLDPNEARELARFIIDQLDQEDCGNETISED